MKWILIVLAVLAGLVILMVLLGAMIPKGHTVSRTIRLKQTPEAVWRVVTDYAASTSWRADLKAVEHLPDRGGHEVWREKNGMLLTLETVESVPPGRLVRRIADPKLPFGGSWTYEIAGSEGGSTLTITENGEVYNPIFRFLSRFVIGQHGTIEAYLKALGKKFGEDVTPAAFKD